MDSKSSIELDYDPGRIDILRFASYILPPAEYKTNLLNFPNTNCHEPYGLKGDFFLTMYLYQDGKKFARVDLPVCKETGVFEFDFENLFSLCTPTKPVIMLAHYSHEKSVPVELYMSNVHRKSGTYIAYPVAAFMGDVLYPQVHETQLENTLFWPGLPPSAKTEAEMIVVNPYKMKYEYEISLFLRDKRRTQTEILSVEPFSSRIHPISELFPQYYAEMVDCGGDGSVCISAQYKVVAFMTMRHKESGVLTAIDHLHTYQLV